MIRAKYYISSTVSVIWLMTASLASAFSFGGGDLGKSGLDLNQGYDVNTVSTVSGRVTALPSSGDAAGAAITIKSGDETVYLYVGPGPYWSKNGIAVRVNDEVTAKGSKAVGKDGKTYLLTQSLFNRTTNGHMNMRNDRGMPGWSGAEIRNDRPSGAGGGPGAAERPGGGMMRSGGGVMRSGGGVMRGGGGGMMRR